MNLRETLQRTGFRASLAPEYMAGRAPDTQRDDGRLPESEASYFGLPAIKAPKWSWLVPAYFFLGGTAAGAYITSTLADIIGRREDRGYVLAGRLVAILGVAIGAVMLILDLGRPERFLNMMRVLKPRSMMNTGSWALSLFGIFGGLAIFVEMLYGFGQRRAALQLLAAILRPLSWLGVLPAMYVGSYTGLLLSTTNVPLWARNHRLLGSLFFSSAMGSGLAATTLVTLLTGDSTASNERRIVRAERTVLWTELALTLASGLAVRGLARPLLTPRYLIGAVSAGLIAPLAIGERWIAVRSVLVLVGALTTRFAWTEAGKKSAEDPHAYFVYTGAQRGSGSTSTRQRHGAIARVDLPSRGTVTGVITVVQEDRFRLEDSVGRGYLFTLGRGLGVGLQQLQQWSARRALLEVDYQGTPDLGAVAHSMRSSS